MFWSITAVQVRLLCGLLWSFFPPVEASLFRLIQSRTVLTTTVASQYTMNKRSWMRRQELFHCSLFQTHVSFRHLRINYGAGIWRAKELPLIKYDLHWLMKYDIQLLHWRRGYSYKNECKEISGITLSLSYSCRVSPLPGTRSSGRLILFCSVMENLCTAIYVYIIHTCVPSV